jgi:hypothetical protein
MSKIKIKDSRNYYASLKRLWQGNGILVHNNQAEILGKIL